MCSEQSRSITISSLTDSNSNLVTLSRHLDHYLHFALFSHVLLSRCRRFSSPIQGITDLRNPCFSHGISLVVFFSQTSQLSSWMCTCHLPRAEPTKCTSVDRNEAPMFIVLWMSQLSVLWLFTMSGIICNLGI